MRALPIVAGLCLCLLLAACERGTQAPAPDAGRRAPTVTIRDDAPVPTPVWEAPAVQIAPAQAGQALAEAEAALREGRLYAGERDALPLLLALRALRPDDTRISAAFDRARAALLVQGQAALDALEDDPGALRRAHEIAGVAQAVAPDDAEVRAFLDRLQRVDAAQARNRRGEAELRAGRLGERGGGALAQFREALRLHPDDVRARQGIAAVESAMIRRAELSAERGDFDTAERWLAHAAEVRPAMPTVDAARERVEQMRRARIAALHDQGLRALLQEGGIPEARRRLDEILRIARPGDPAAAELRERIDLAEHYGLFRPGQRFTDALQGGGRGPRMVVVPHGGFRMGAVEGDDNAADAERPAHYVRFDRGFAMSATEITVAEFRRFVEATGHRSRAVRRGHSTVYDERSGTMVKRSGMDWRHGYDGRPAADDDPVLHVSVRDAEAFAEWLSAQSGQRYRLPSEAEFEYALRAGTQHVYPWPDGVPPRSAGNLTGEKDVSPRGRRWRNAFRGYGDGWWGPAPAGSFPPNAYGLHDLAGNLSEWVADCWHDSYRRAPADGHAWYNPGCRTRVIRGGSWASAPEQVRASWRLGADADTTNARVGFRVVREL
ncbi:formylglycine-generating enzyme family protein [Vulcaniibacterium gelatinicum]|uniref:formylglycine-generating enzyme family protein n=1 Tax=Vulcaniibacterium gelatinicum TaxID=2598725 RepID=UPI0011CB73C3|nr:formylglycine-generating enzyme family protein [Vulcaniibacterium gelatinicum]